MSKGAGEREEERSASEKERKRERKSEKNAGQEEKETCNGEKAIKGAAPALPTGGATSLLLTFASSPLLSTPSSAHTHMRASLSSHSISLRQPDCSGSGSLFCLPLCLCERARESECKEGQRDARQELRVTNGE